MGKRRLSLLLSLPPKAPAETPAAQMPEWAQDEIADLRAPCASSEKDLLTGAGNAVSSAGLNADWGCRPDL